MLEFHVDTATGCFSLTGQFEKEPMNGKLFFYAPWNRKVWEPWNPTSNFGGFSGEPFPHPTISTTFHVYLDVRQNITFMHVIEPITFQFMNNTCNCSKCSSVNLTLDSSVLTFTITGTLQKEKDNRWWFSNAFLHFHKQEYGNVYYSMGNSFSTSVGCINVYLTIFERNEEV